MDDLGSVLKVVDSSGNVKNSYYYDPYGMSLNKNETVSTPWQYASGYYDANTGLYKFGTRYYDPQTGRWTQKDPVGGSVGKIGSGNPYVYAGNEPTMQVDPSGRNSTFCDISIIGTIGQVAGSVIALIKDYVTVSAAQSALDAADIAGEGITEANAAFVSASLGLASTLIVSISVTVVLAGLIAYACGDIK